MKYYYTLILLICLTRIMDAQVIEQDSLALVAFYHATDGPEWTVDSNWLSGEPAGTWHGVEVTNGRVTGIELLYNELSGSLPEELGQLTGMTYLILYGNAIEGHLPAALANLSSLETLNLSANQLSGTIPAEFANLDHLYQLNLYRNGFSGPFPQVVLDMDSLTRLSLGVNQFSGPIPAEINELTHLVHLSLEQNAFTGAMPSIKALTQLSDLYLHQNQLTGDVSDFLGYYPHMWYIKLDANDFTGCLSDTFFNPQQMQFLDFSECNISCLGDFSQYVSGGAIRRINARDNRLPFEGLETCVGTFQFHYAPQQSLLEPDTLVLQAGDTIEIVSGSAGMYTQYQWFQDGDPIPGETETTLTITGFTADDAGVYHCEMTNDSLPDLTLRRSPVTLQLEGASAVQAPDIRLLEIYPNPATHLIYLPPFAEDGIIRIIQTGGQVVLQSSVSEQVHSISVEMLPAGVYTITATTRSDVYAGRFVRF